MSSLTSNSASRAQKVTFRVTFFFLITFLLSSTLKADLVCPQALVSETHSLASLKRVFNEAWYKKDLFCKSKCHENVISLFLALKNEIPELKAEDFKVLFITHPKQRGYFITGFEVQDTRENSRNSPLSWGYHVVLEYEGHIFDLSRARPLIYQKSEYLSGFIINSFTDFAFFKRRDAVSDLVLYSISGENYLQPDFHFRIRTIGQIDELLRGYTPIELLSYMNE